MTDTNIIGELMTRANLHLEVRFEHDQIHIICFPGTMCHFSLYIQDPEDAEALAMALECGKGDVNIDQQQSVSVVRRADGDFTLHIGRDDDYVSLYLPHLTQANARDLALFLRQGIDKLEAQQAAEAERHLRRPR